MHLTIALEDGNIFNVEATADSSLMSLKTTVAFQCDINSNSMEILHNGQLLTDDTKTMNSYGVTEGDVLLAKRRGGSVVPSPAAAPVAPNNSSLPMFDFSRINIPSGGAGLGSSAVSSIGQNAQRFREMFLSDPERMAMLRLDNPPLAAAIDAGGEQFQRIFDEITRTQREQEELRLRIANNPFDAEAQRLMLQEIERQNIQSNMEAAMEYHPESFGVVHMLFINCKISGFPVKAFVDSGAQATIMSSDCAKRCNIDRLIDRRHQGIAKGVGTQKIIGKIHLVDIQIERDFLASSFTVLENQDVDMLLGLDMLKRHQCVIDLKENVLVIGTTGTKTSFLSESEIPKNMFKDF